MTVELQGVLDALKAGNTAGALSQARNATSGLLKIADLVAPAQPDADEQVRAAADDLDKAIAQFPGGVSLVDQAKTEFETGLQLARTVRC